uniref:Ethanolaminephosphotransferase 1 n=1 Tax=Strigamia maritima TaxID=126957 RepID=T1IL50_STRMM
MASLYLSSEHLTGFEHYKYSALDTSPLSNYIMHPFWNAVVKLCPSWLAPNVLTFTGFLLTVVNFITFSYYDFSFYAPAAIPSLIWLIVAINHFLAHSLDGIDGKQARRTRSSSPLGELFDHGLDSWSTIFTPTCLYSVFGRSDYSISPLRFYFCLWSVFFTFISSHWEKYNTGVLYLPWGYDFSLILAFITYLITFSQGVTFWHHTIPVINMSTGTCLELFLHLGAYGLSLPVSLYNIYVSYRDKTGKMRTLYEANRPLVSTLVFFCICTVWVTYSPVDIISHHPRCFYLLMGTVFSNISCRLIVSQMSNTRCALLNYMMLPVAVVTFLSIQHFPGEVFLLYLVTLCTIIAHSHYGVVVVRQMCQHFNLYCFQLKRPSSE